MKRSYSPQTSFSYLPNVSFEKSSIKAIADDVTTTMVRPVSHISRVRSSHWRSDSLRGTWNIHDDSDSKNSSSFHLCALSHFEIMENKIPARVREKDSTIGETDRRLRMSTLTNVKVRDRGSAIGIQSLRHRSAFVECAI